MSSALEPGLSLVATLELEELQDRLLAALAVATDALGGALWLAEGEGRLTLRGLRGLAHGAALPPLLDPAAAPLAAPLSRGQPFAPPGFAKGALLVPLVHGGEVLGAVLLERPARGPFEPARRAAAAELARFAAVAVRNARRFRATERAGLRDRETGAYHLGYFLDHAGKELDKSRRYERGLSLAVITLDDPEGLERELGPPALQAATRGVAAVVSRVARDADVLARVSQAEHYVLLPETDRFGALMFQRRVAAELRREPALRALEERRPLALALGAATFPWDGAGFDDLLAACRGRQEAQRRSLLRQVERDGRRVQGFWELVDALHDGPPIPPGAPSARLPVAPDLLDAVQREGARELGRDPRCRCLLHLARPGGRAEGAAAAGLAAAGTGGHPGSRVYLLGPRRQGAPEAADHPRVARACLEGDARLSGHAFALLLSEGAAYAFLEAPDGRVFHTSDAPLVDALTASLHEQYDLQPP